MYRFCIPARITLETKPYDHHPSLNFVPALFFVQTNKLGRCEASARHFIHFLKNQNPLASLQSFQSYHLKRSPQTSYEWHNAES